MTTRDYAAERRARCNAREAVTYAPAIGASREACLPLAASALSLALLGEAPTGAEDAGMSACISSAGEYSEHVSTPDFTCARCFVFDEEGALAEIADLRQRLALVAETTYWDRPYDTRIEAIRLAASR